MRLGKKQIAWILICFAVGGVFIYQYSIYVENENLSNALLFFKDGQYEKSAKLLTPLAEGGDQTAQHILGISYAHGHGVKINRKKAQSLIRRAYRDIEAAEVFYHIAKRFAEGENVIQNQSEAIYWYQKAAELGNKDAKQILSQEKQ